jgi:proteasome lid subunit RPN8/RPN11
MSARRRLWLGLATLVAVSAVAVLVARRREPLKATAPLPEAAPSLVWKNLDDQQYRPERLSADRLQERLGVEPTRVIISREADAAMRAHLNSDRSIELGGVLVGYAVEVEDGSFCTVVTDAVPAEGGVGTAVSFDFTPESWLRMNERLRGLPHDRVIVGWYHSHPDLGVFLSGTDMFTQSRFFAEPWKLAIVIDPVRGQEGHFLGKEGLRELGVCRI